MAAVALVGLVLVTMPAGPTYADQPPVAIGNTASMTDTVVNTDAMLPVDLVYYGHRGRHHGYRGGYWPGYSGYYRSYWPKYYYGYYPSYYYYSYPRNCWWYGGVKYCS
jgi:hypothetical protein